MTDFALHRYLRERRSRDMRRRFVYWRNRILDMVLITAAGVAIAAGLYVVLAV